MRRKSSAVHTARATRIALSSALLASVALSCGGSDGPTITDRTPIRIISGGGQTDTVHAFLSQAVVVEVRDSTGKLAPGRTVRFAAIELPGASLTQTNPFVYVSLLATQNYNIRTSVEADAQGHAKAFVQMGHVAGMAAVEISVPDFAVADTILFTVKPGMPALLTIAPSDTTLQPGASYTMRSLVTDAMGNPIGGLAPTYTASSGVSVTSAGQVTGGSTFARAGIVATFGTATAIASVSVLERLPIVANDGGKVVSLNTDRTGETVLDPNSDYALSPHSVKASTSVVYFHGDWDVNSKVWVAEPGKAPRQLLPGAPGFEAWPRLSPDGVWVYFVRNKYTVWRAHLDGTSLDSLGTVSTTDFYRAPAISPDGGTIAVPQGTGLKLIDVATRAATIMPAECLHPRYSPDGASFVCWTTAGIVVMKTDGTGTRILAPNFGPFGLTALAAPDWSPDGKWIIIGDGARIVDVVTGAVMPLSLPPEASFVR